MNVKDLWGQGEELFSKRSTLLSLWQEIADNFYPERADFTYQRTLGTDFASNLMTSYPIMCRRDFSDQIGQMLRPTAKHWFHPSVRDVEREDNEAQRWLQYTGTVMRRAMYDPVTQFTKATKQGDNDFSCFGQAALQVRLNRNADALLYRCHHLRDMAWMEDENGKICAVWRKWKPTARDLVRHFGTRAHPDVAKAVSEGKPFTEVQCAHMIVSADMYDENARGRAYWSIYYDVEHDHAMEKVAQKNREYVIPRWLQVSGSQYAFSPATVAALPEARLLQAMTYTLLEAGEKATNPPMIATQEAVRSDVAIYAGGVTWVDREYDERLGDALRPLTQDMRGLPFGENFQQDSRAMLMQAFYLNKLTLPQRGPEMTAYEIGQRVQEYIRGALPIFEPMEMEYNGGICEETWELLLNNGAFGPLDRMPASLRDAEMQFRFESPLHDAVEQQKGQTFLEMKGIIAQAMEMDPSIAVMPDAATALRDVLQGIGVPAKWVRSEVSVAEIQRQQQAQQQAQATLQTMQQGAEVAQTMATAQREQAAAQAQVAA